jgi:hypothetical protein
MFRLTLLGVGAMNSPRFAPAGLLVEHRGARVMLDGGPGSAAHGPIAAWPVTNPRAELIRQIRRLASIPGAEPELRRLTTRAGLRIVPRRVVHTSHQTYGYMITAEGRRIVWAPEFWRLAHIGRPTIRAMDAGRAAAVRELREGWAVYEPRRWRGS